VSLGEYRVGLDFNPAGNPQVFYIKKVTAHMIDYLEDHRTSDPEVNRLIVLAQDKVESAAMDGVKAVTKRPRD
jgi:hypothetical protein